jgi:hypothetical protein
MPPIRDGVEPMQPWPTPAAKRDDTSRPAAADHSGAGDRDQGPGLAAPSPFSFTEAAIPQMPELDDVFTEAIQKIYRFGQRRHCSVRRSRLAGDWSGERLVRSRSSLVSGSRGR